jgi:GGDEF domain-containing protein
MISIDRLRELQERIEQASTIEDVRALKLELSDCIRLIRIECVLPDSPETKPQAASTDSDSLTGLPLRSGAEQAMKVACAAAAHAYAGLFVMDRIQAINSRFGNELGDKVVLFFVQHLSGALTGKDTLYRWSPISFLALLDRRESPDHVRRAIVRTMSQRREQTFEIGERSVVLPTSSTWVVIPLFEHAYSEILQKLEAFSGLPRRT